MAYFPIVTVAFDDGPTVEVQSSSRDMLGLEKEGVDPRTTPTVEWMYRLTFVTLQRYARLGKLPEGFDLPDTWEAFSDIADCDDSGADLEGKGSGQELSTGE